MSSPPPTTTTSAKTSSPLIKPLIGAATCFCLDTFAFHNLNQQATITMAAAVGVAFLAAPYISNALPFESTLSSIGNDNGISAEARLVECALGVGAAYGIEQYIFKQEIQSSDLTTKLMLVVGSNFISTYASEYLNGEALVYVKGTGL